MDLDLTNQIPGMKRLLEHLFGYGPTPRGPLSVMEEAAARKLLIEHPDILALLEIEKKLEASR